MTLSTFSAVSLGEAPLVTAPDGSQVRPLCVIPGAGSFAQFRLEPGEVAKAVVYATVQEIWYVVAGAGQIWLADDTNEAVVDLRPGVCATIPLGTRFQFRASPDDALEVVAATMPPWPVESDTEASPVPGPWQATF